MDSKPFLQQPLTSRIAEYVTITVGFVKAYDRMNPDVISVSDAIDWFIHHNTNLQTESVRTRRRVKRLVTWKVSNPYS